MLTRRSIIMAAAFTFAFGTAHADEPAAFSAEVFDAAQNQDKPILIEITASWCPTCKIQAPIIDELTQRDTFKDLVVLRVDFDTQKDVVRNFGANMQSTLIVFKGRNEVSRSVGETNPEVIEAQIAAAVSG